MNASEVLGYLIWIGTTVTVLLVGRDNGPLIKPIAWQSRMAWSGFAAFIGALLGATPLILVFILVGIGALFAPKIGDDTRRL
jgi:hypothetical protein